MTVLPLARCHALLPRVALLVFALLRDAPISRADAYLLPNEPAASDAQASCEQRRGTRSDGRGQSWMVDGTSCHVRILAEPRAAGGGWFWVLGGTATSGAGPVAGSGLTHSEPGATDVTRRRQLLAPRRRRVARPLTRRRFDCTPCRA